MRIWLFLIGCPLKISGLSHFKKGEAFIVVFNHNTMMDIPLSCPFVPGANKTIAKSSFAKIPLFGWFYRKGVVLVDRKSEKSRRLSFEVMKKAIDFVNDLALVEAQPKMEGKQMFLMLGPDPLKIKEYQKAHPNKSKQDTKQLDELQEIEEDDEE
ncbi:MAG: hypothetical protein FGM46_10070 [Ferruginibacter sp.]|nr:hypothetical protein [Ferruginibacter sp.]